MWLHPSESRARRDHVVENSSLRSGVNLAIHEHRNAQGIGLTRADVQVPGFSEVVNAPEGKHRLHVNFLAAVCVYGLIKLPESRVLVITSENLLAAHLLAAQVTKAGR